MLLLIFPLIHALASLSLRWAWISCPVRVRAHSRQMCRTRAENSIPYASSLWAKFRIFPASRCLLCGFPTISATWVMCYCDLICTALRVIVYAWRSATSVVDLQTILVLSPPPRLLRRHLLIRHSFQIHLPVQQVMLTQYVSWNRRPGGRRLLILRTSRVSALWPTLTSSSTLR